MVLYSKELKISKSLSEYAHAAHFTIITVVRVAFAIRYCAGAEGEILKLLPHELVHCRNEKSLQRDVMRLGCSPSNMFGINYLVLLMAVSIVAQLETMLMVMVGFLTV